MRKLLLAVAVVGVLSGSVFACGDHAKTLGDALAAGKSIDEAVKITTGLKEGEVIAASKKGTDGKFTRIYNSAVAGGTVSEPLSGDAETNTAMMFKAVDGKKVGEAVDVSFKSADGKDMKAQVMLAGNDTVCAIMWPAANVVAPTEAKKEETPAAPAATPAAAPAPAAK